MTLFYGHQPRITYDQQLTQDSPYEIQEPEVSQAFYGQLQGEPDFYEIIAGEPFALYVQILKPDYEERVFSVEITKDGTPFASLDGSTYTWTSFYEEYGGDTYWMGPEYEAQAPAGRYVIEVSSAANNGAANRGKYSLAVGKREIFTTTESINALKLMPRLKREFWGKPATDALAGKATRTALIGGLAVVLLIIVLVVWLAKRR